MSRTFVRAAQEQEPLAPFGLASPAAWLAEMGAEVSCLDLAVESLTEDTIRAAGLIGIRDAISARR